MSCSQSLHLPCAAMIFLVEGCGQTNLAKNWGDGLATDPALVSSYNIDSAASLFTALLKRSYVNQVCLCCKTTAVWGSIFALTSSVTSSSSAKLAETQLE